MAKWRRKGEGGQREKTVHGVSVVLGQKIIAAGTFPSFCFLLSTTGPGLYLLSSYQTGSAATFLAE